MKGVGMLRMMAIAAAAGLANSVGGAMAGFSRLSAYEEHVRKSTTVSPDVSQWGYAKGPGWSAAHVKRMSAKKRNRARHRLAVRK